MTANQTWNFTAEIIDIPDYLTLGSTMEEVRAVQGEPSSIDVYSSFTIWGYGSYGLATIRFSNDTNKVIAYSDYENVLNIGS